MRLVNLTERLVAGQRDLGPLLRFESIVPFTVLAWVAGGSLLTLPPGPLCDEGMVLFMEGGCDWGVSNIFFFAKASLLLTVNLALIVTWLRPPVSWRGLWVHFALLALLGYLYRSDCRCDSYYAHPNGSLGQMVLEMACFAALGVGLGRATLRSRWLSRLAILVAWNSLHVGLFYLYLGLSPHWTWIHTAAVGGTLLVAAAVVWRLGTAGATDRLRELRVGEDRQSGRWSVLSAFFIAATFGLLWNPLGLAPIAFLCIGLGLATAALVKRVAGSVAARFAAVVVALALPVYGVVWSCADYAEKDRYANSLLETVSRPTLEDAAALEAVAASTGYADDNYEPADLSNDAAVQVIAERVPGSARLRSGSRLSLFVPLGEERYFRISWWRLGEPDRSFVADVIEHLVTEESYLEAHEAVRHFDAGGSSPWPSRARYVADTALRWRPAPFYSAATTVDNRGRVRAMVVVRVDP